MIKTFNEFLLESKGMPNSVYIIAQDVTKLLISKYRNEDFIGESLQFKPTKILHDFPVTELNIEYVFKNSYTINTLVVTGAFYPDLFMISSKGIKGAFDFDVHISEFYKSITDKKDFIEKLEEELMSTVSHELIHMFEEYKRTAGEYNSDKTPLSMKYDKSVIATNAAQEMLDPALSIIYIPKTYDKFFIENGRIEIAKKIFQFFTLVYASARYELNAFVGESYHKIQKIKKSKNPYFLDDVRQLRVYRFCTDMYAFKAEDIKTSIKNNIKQSHDSERIADEILDLIVKEFTSLTKKEYVTLVDHVTTNNFYSSDMKEKIMKKVEASMKQASTHLLKEPIDFFRNYENFFKRTADHIHDKIIKMIDEKN